MKRFTLAVLVLSALALYSSQPPLPTGTETGRSPTAAPTSPPLKPAPSPPTTFRTDTTTGKAWQLAAVPLRHAKGMTTVPTWVEIEEANGELYQTAIQSLRGN